jgi:hypothetical protein
MRQAQTKRAHFVKIGEKEIFFLLLYFYIQIICNYFFPVVIKVLSFFEELQDLITVLFCKNLKSV